MDTLEKNTEREPLFHIVKRTDIPEKKKIHIYGVALVSALLLCFIFVLASEHENPFILFASLFTGSFENYATFWVLLKNWAILLALGLALVPAFKMKFWNTGADGQALIAAMGCYLVMYFLGGKIPSALVCIIALVVSILLGIMWACIPAIFKAFFNTNETLFTLMMNYVAVCIVSFFVNTYGKDNKLNLVTKGILPMGHKYLTIVLIVAILTLFITIYLEKSKHGYEVSLVGESVSTAKYAGINVKWVIIRTMMLSGGICGLVGFMLTAGLNKCVSTSVLQNRGFTAIIVAYMADFNPLLMVLTSFFYVFLQTGSKQFLMEICCTNMAIADIITSIFFFFIIGCTFFIQYKVVFRKRGEKNV